jgi:tetratricopeptide (TPR) repeat protein
MLNRNDEAINDYKIALVYSPQDAVRILTNRSNLFMLLGRFKEAIADFDYLISVDTLNFVFYYNRGIAKQATNDISGAVSDYQKALQLQPDDQMIKTQLQKLLIVKTDAGKKYP